MFEHNRISSANLGRIAIGLSFLLVLQAPIAAPQSQIAAADDSREILSARVLIHRKKSAADQPEKPFLDSLERDTGIKWRHARGKAGDIEVLDAEGNLKEHALRALRARPDIEYAEFDRRRHKHAVPNDSLYSGQWYLQSAQSAAIGADIAWNTTTGSGGTVIAVLDTGVRFDHPDLARVAESGKLLPGYDFVSADGGSGATTYLIANDGDGWDPDPTDPGDWIDSNDKSKSIFASCDIENSSWHGTRVAGLIAAASNNAVGIAGTSWQSWILPVRVLGKCGGFDSDILPAIRWAAGLPVSGVPMNPYPAKIINLSFGSDEVCNPMYQAVIQELAQIGVLVVSSAGNSGGPVDSPANCPGIVAVAGLRHAGTKVGYSSLGPEVALSAPAGNCVNTSGPCLYSLDTTFDMGRTTPGGPSYTDQINTNLGTSFSSPLAAGVAALMHSVNARLTTQMLRARLIEGARSFPTTSTTIPVPPVCHVPTGSSDLQNAECICTKDTCGAGMLYAPGSVAAALRPIANIAVPASVVAGSTLDIDGSGSVAACNRSVTTYSWAAVPSQSSATPTLSNANQSIVQVTVPATGFLTLRLTVTDDQGSTDTGDITITTNTATTTTSAPLQGPACPMAVTVSQTPPVTPSSQPLQGSNHGGGELDFGILCVLAAIARYRPRPNSICRKS